MNDGFIKVAAVTPEVTVADTQKNAKIICDDILQATALGAKIIVFPELCLTGYTCADLFYHDVLLKNALRALSDVVSCSIGADALIFVGCPLRHSGKLYNCAVAINNGKILGAVPKTFLPNYNEFYEKRWFAPAPEQPDEISLLGQTVPFGRGILFCCEQMQNLTVGAEICEDLWTPMPPSVTLALSGATITVNLSASNECVGKSEYRKALVSSQSARLVCGYVYCSAGDGESTTDLVFSGHNIIAENGRVLAESNLFENEITVSEIDVDFLSCERAKIYPAEITRKADKIVYFSIKKEQTSLTRAFSRYPFVPKDSDELHSRAKLILTMQSKALAKRIDHTHTKSLVIGVSGGLDSSLALIVAKLASEASKTKPEVIAVTMPCFGTTDRTHDNSIKLSEALGVTLKEVDIKKAVLQHFEDIGQNAGTYDVTYENGQARERTQVLMDIANKTGGMVVGTGDLSELALGWATYNGDHMSMYGVNASVPKTLIRYLINHYALSADKKTKEVLGDILDTPVSPELLPSDGKNISQKTEDLVGPYELHDFFLYYMLRMYYSPKKIFRAAKLAFPDYDEKTIAGWLKVFVRRFFAQQFKRSCLPDGVKIGSVSLSPRGDWRMPSDAAAACWLTEAEETEKLVNNK